MRQAAETATRTGKISRTCIPPPLPSIGSPARPSLPRNAPTTATLPITAPPVSVLRVLALRFCQSTRSAFARALTRSSAAATAGSCRVAAIGRPGLNAHHEGEYERFQTALLAKALAAEAQAVCCRPGTATRRRRLPRSARRHGRSVRRPAQSPGPPAPARPARTAPTAESTIIISWRSATCASAATRSATSAAPARNPEKNSRAAVSNGRSASRCDDCGGTSAAAEREASIIASSDRTGIRPRGRRRGPRAVVHARIRGTTRAARPAVASADRHSA